MCGINLIISKEKTKLLDAIKFMEKAQIHRGPDNQKIKIIENKKKTIALGFQRLSILDLNDRSNQPYYIKALQSYLMFNGEIYNYLEIKKQLPKNYQNKVHGDSSLVKFAYLFWGKECFKKFRGMWSIVIINLKKNEIIISKDHFGIKPLYFYKNKKFLIIASEIKSILSSKMIKKQKININSINNFINKNITNYNNETFFKNIKSFSPNKLITFDLNNFNFSNQSNLFNLKKSSSNKLNLPEIKEKIIKSVKLHALSDVKLGVLLSGGLDSSIITSCLNSINPKRKINTFSVISNDKKFSEEKFSDIIHKKFKTNHNKFNFNKINNSLKNLEKVNWFNDQPIISLSAMAHFETINAARQKGFKVLLSGQGSDEFFLGYKKYIYFYLYELLKNRRYFKFIKSFFGFLFNSDFILNFSLNEASRYLSSQNKLKNLFGKKFKRKNINNEKIYFKSNFLERNLDDIFKYSLPTLLHYEDRVSMGNSVELRVPFVDIEIFKNIINLKTENKFFRGFSKSILKFSFKNDLPKNIIFRKVKYGYNLPEETWIEENKDNILNHYSESNLFKTGYLKYDEFKKFLNKSNNIKQVFSIISLLSWDKSFSKFIKY